MLPFLPLITAGVSAGAGLYAGNKASKQNAQVQQGMAQTQAQQMGLFNQAQQLFPAMAGLAGQYGQGAQGFLGDRAALMQMQGDYAPLMDQMTRLYGQNPTGPALDVLGGLAGQDVTSGPLSQIQALAGQDVLGGRDGALSQLQVLYNNGGATDGGAGAALRGNAQSVLGATDPGVYREQARLAGEDAMGQLASSLASRGIASSGTSSRLGAATLSRLYADAAARGQQDRLNAYGISNSALGQAGQMSLAQGQQQASLLGQMGSLALQGQGQRAGLLGQILQGGLAGQSQRAGIAGQMGQLGLAGQGQQANLLGQMAGLLGQRQQGVLAGSGLLGQYLSGLQGQAGMLGNIAGLYNQQAGALGGMWQQQASQVNPNPYAGLMGGLGALGPAAGQYLDWRAKGMTGMSPVTGPGTGQGMPGFGISYPMPVLRSGV